MGEPSGFEVISIIVLFVRKKSCYIVNIQMTYRTLTNILHKPKAVYLPELECSTNRTYPSNPLVYIYIWIEHFNSTCFSLKSLRTLSIEPCTKNRSSLPSAQSVGWDKQTSCIDPSGGFSKSSQSTLVELYLVVL